MDPKETTDPSRRGGARVGCLAVVALAAALLGWIVWRVHHPRLDLEVVTHPPGVIVELEGEAGSAPHRFRRYLEGDGGTLRIRVRPEGQSPGVLDVHWSDGFKTGFRAVVSPPEPGPGIAWVETSYSVPPQRIEIWLPRAGRSLLWLRLEGGKVPGHEPTTEGPFWLPPGRHSIAAESWSFVLECDPGFAVELDGGTGGRGSLVRLDQRPGLARAELHVDGAPTVDLLSGPIPMIGAAEYRIELEARDRRRLSLEARVVEGEEPEVLRVWVRDGWFGG